MKFEDAFTALCPGVELFPRTPATVPRGPYAVLTQVADSKERDYFTDHLNHRTQERRTVLLLNVWGGEDWTVEKLRPIVKPLRQQLADFVTEYADLPPLSGVTRGPHNIEPPSTALKRPMFWMRLELTYLE